MLPPASSQPAQEAEAARKKPSDGPAAEATPPVPGADPVPAKENTSDQQRTKEIYEAAMAAAHLAAIPVHPLPGGAASSGGISPPSPTTAMQLG